LGTLTTTAPSASASVLGGFFRQAADALTSFFTGNPNRRQTASSEPIADRRQVSAERPVAARARTRVVADYAPPAVPYTPSRGTGRPVEYETVRTTRNSGAPSRNTAVPAAFNGLPALPGKIAEEAAPVVDLSPPVETQGDSEWTGQYAAFAAAFAPIVEDTVDNTAPRSPERTPKTGDQPLKQPVPCVKAELPQFTLSRKVKARIRPKYGDMR
jgi:hypothetical protein